MERKTIFALCALLALGALAVWTLKAPEKGDRVGDKPRPVAEVKAADVAAIDISQPGGKEKATLTRKGDKWQVTAPYDKPADASAAKSMTEGLEKMKWGDITTRRKESQGDLEVSEDKAIHVVAKDSAGKVLADLYLGKSTGTGTMVRPGGSDDVYQVTEIFPYNFKRDAKDWRDKVIFDNKADEAEKVVLIGGGTSVALERLPAEKGPDGKPKSTGIYEAKWKIVQGPDARAMAPGSTSVDDALVNRLVQGLAALRAADYQDDAKPADTGLSDNDPNLKVVRVTYQGGKTAGLRIGGQKGEDTYAQAEGSPQVFTAKKYTMESLAHLPQDLRDKTLLKVKADDLAEVTVQQGADTLTLKKTAAGWKADKVAAQDDAKVKGIGDGFENLAGSGFVAPGTKELASLAKPRATVTVKPKSGPPVILKIGDVVGDDYVVQKTGMDAVYVKKYAIERFLKKPAEIAKK